MIHSPTIALTCEINVSNSRTGSHQFCYRGIGESVIPPVSLKSTILVTPHSRCDMTQMEVMQVSPQLCDTIHHRIRHSRTFGQCQAAQLWRVQHQIVHCSISNSSATRQIHHSQMFQRHGCWHRSDVINLGIPWNLVHVHVGLVFRQCTEVWESGIGEV